MPCPEINKTLKEFIFKAYKETKGTILRYLTLKNDD